MFSASDLTAIKNAVNADPTALAAWNAGNRGNLCIYLNSAPATGAAMVTRKDVTQGELFTCLVPSEIATLAQWQQTILQLTSAAAPIDFTNASIAAGLVSIFPPTTQTYKNLMAVAQRAATRLEAIFLTNGVSSHFGDQIDVPTLIAAMGA